MQGGRYQKAAAEQQHSVATSQRSMAGEEPGSVSSGNATT